MNRPKTYTIAAILQWLISSLAIIGTIPFLAQGPNAAEAPPFFVVVLAFAAGVLGLVSAYGVWRNQKWGVILTILLRALDGLAAVPGIFFAPSTFLWVSAMIGTVVSLVIIVLLLWPKPRLARAVPNA
jgi:uncharacterized membrane protein (DUF2068 family)